MNNYTDMLQQIIQLVTVLFLLSMVCERIADFLKYYLSNKQFLWIPKEFFKIGDTQTKYPKDELKEKARAFRILKINVGSGILLATILKADLIKIFNHIENPGETIGWNNLCSSYEGIEYGVLPFGIILTGLFISFGSKFWHDLLDLLYQIKNTKRVLTNPETYSVDNVKSLQKLFDTYQSDFIKAAYLDAKTKFMAIDSVKAIGIKRNDIGYYFEINISQNVPEIEQSYPYIMDDGTLKNIPIKVVVLDDGDEILALGVDLSAKIFTINREEYGTLGVLVKRKNDESNTKYLLTCCHNVVQPIENIPVGNRKSIITATLDGREQKTIGTVYTAVRDHEIDAALIQIEDSNLIENFVPNMGSVNKTRRCSTGC